MKENDKAFIDQVVDFYCTTVDEAHPQGNMSAVADQFGITRAKVNKILITAGVIDSPLHRDIMELKDQGYETDDIAAALGVSAATVRINIPYEKVIYNGEEKSAGAGDVEEYRKREQIFLNSVVRKKTDREIQREIYLSDPQNQAIVEFMKEQGMLDDIDRTDDPVHFQPYFTEEEAKLFKMNPDVMLLHIELDDLIPEEDRALCGIKHGEPISRDILVQQDLPLHNLHYVINQAFGFSNSHIHEFVLSGEDLKWVTAGKVENWKKLVGLVFKNPLRDEDLDFWDDDYEGGSPKKWMRSKYTGPGYVKCYEEGYRNVIQELGNWKVTEKEVRDAIQRVCVLARPVILAADGYPLMDDCGGIDGYVDILSSIEDGDKDSKAWANSMGWKKKIDKNVL